MIRLDRYLTGCGLGSREFVKNLIKNGRIRVEGVDTPKPETKLAENAAVFFDGAPLSYSEFTYLLMHKPAGVLTARTDEKTRTVMDLVDSKVPDLSPVGRLDKDTEGLLLITNDGALAHRLLSPKNEVPKTYYLRTETPIPETAPELLSKPVVFSEFTSKPAVLKLISPYEAEITVTEGKYHEVKRLMHAAGSDVVYLKRLAFGPLRLGDLPAGKVRALTDEEIRTLRESVRNGETHEKTRFVR